MRYKRYSENNDLTLHQVLSNRGIPEEDIETWMSASLDQINDWHSLNQIEDATKCVRQTVENNEDILVIVDCDADGFTSAAIFINFLFILFPDYTEKHITFFLHEGKQHGLGDVDVSNNISLVVCPDSASNDYEIHKQLAERGIKVLILDHHEAPHISEDAITVNNQLCNYPNKDFSGAGITWQFCRAYEELMYNTHQVTDTLLDLCALGNLSDMMNYRSLETRTIVDQGLKNIHNPFFYYMVEKNKMSIDKMGGINYMSIAFYVTPFINAIVRSGTMNEKQLIFKSMLAMYAFENIESEKRGHKGELVPLVEEAVRVATNVKARQTKLQDASMALLKKRIEEQNLLENSVIVLCCEPGDVEKNIAGLCANKIQAEYQRPTLVLTKSRTKDDKEYFYRGSARNYSHSEIEDMRQLCEDTNLVEYAQGHQGAFGFSIPEKNIEAFIQKTNELYGDVSLEPVYWVDAVWDNVNQIPAKNILDISESKKYWGQEVQEPYVCLVDIPLSPNSVRLLSPDKHPTIKITLSNGIDIMKFKSSQEEYEQFIQPNAVLTAVCKCAKNEWNGKVTPQLIIENYEIQQKWMF